MHRRIGGAGGKESGNGKTAFRKKKEGIYAHRLKRWEDRQRRGECVEEAVCECQSSSGCQTSVIDHKPTQPSRCWGLSLNRCTSFTFAHIYLYTLIQCIHVCRWPHLRTSRLSLVHRAQTCLGCFPCSGWWSTVSHSHWSENKTSQVDSSYWCFLHPAAELQTVLAQRWHNLSAHSQPNPRLNPYYSSLCS